MAPLTPQFFRELRQSLPVFEQATFTAAAESPLVQQYKQFYDLQFSTAHEGVEHRLGRVQSGRYSLAVQCWQQPGASQNLLLIHGYFDHSGLYGKLIEYGLRRGCNVLIFDLPGHGLSTGELAAIDDFGEYGQAIADVLAAAELPDLPWWVMAQSTGCSALIEFARSNRWNFSAAVLLAPLIRPAAWLWVRAAHSLLHYFISSTKRGFARNSSDQAFLAFLKADPLQSRRVSMRWIAALKRWLAQLPIEDMELGPVLVLQGDADGTVDWRYNIPRIRTLFKGCQVAYLEGAGHQLANESAAIRRYYLNEIDRFLQAL